KDVFAEFLDPALAQALVAGQVADDPGQTRPNTMGSYLGRDGCPGDVPAAPAGAGVPLVLGHRDQDLWQLDHLVPGRLRVIGPGGLGQSRLAVRARPGHVRDGPSDEFGIQSAFEVRRVAGLAAGLAPGRLLGRADRQPGRRPRGRWALALQPRRQV